MKIIEKSIEIAKALFPPIYENRQRYQAYHFCFVWRRNTLISAGTNDVINPSCRALMLAKRFNSPDLVEWPYLHAEIDCVQKLWGRYNIDSKLKTVVLRLNADMALCDSKPCDKCIAILEPLGMTKKLWFSQSEGFSKYEM